MKNHTIILRPCKSGFLLSLLFAGFLINTSILAQNPVEWAPIGATWYYQIRLDLGQPAVSWIKLMADRDSMINGELFRVVQIETDFPDRLITNQFLLKQIGEQLFFRLDSIDHLIYDFSLSVGDTLIVKNPTTLIRSLVDLPYDTLVIEEVGSLEINGQSRREQVVKSLGLGSDYGPGLIEGIGSIGPWFFPTFISVAEDIDVIDGFRCYEDDQIGLYKTVEEPCDFDNVSVPVTESLSPSFELFPNPFIDQISIRCLDCSGLRFQIIDVQGRVYDHGLITDPIQSFNLGLISGKILFAKIGDETSGFILKKILRVY